MRINPENMLMQPMSFERMASKSSRPASFVGQVPNGPTAGRAAPCPNNLSENQIRRPRPWEKVDEPFDADELCRKLNRFKALQDDRELRQAHILAIKFQQQQSKKVTESSIVPVPEIKFEPSSKTEPAAKEATPYRHQPRHAAKGFKRTSMQPVQKPTGIFPSARPILSPQESVAKPVLAEKLDSIKIEVSNIELSDGADSPPYGGHSNNSPHDGSQLATPSDTEELHRPYNPKNRPNWTQEDEREARDWKRFTLFRENPVITDEAHHDIARSDEVVIFPAHPAVRPLIRSNSRQKTKARRMPSRFFRRAKA